MSRRVLHVLSQRPHLTGSGVTLDALVRWAGEAGWEQSVVVGMPGNEGIPSIGGLPPERVHPLRFETPELPFPVPGMSDVMPYRSTVFSAMSRDDLSRYRSAWRGHLHRVIQQYRPEVIHAHHIWLMSSLLRRVAPGMPLVLHSHATGLRQMELCPHLAGEVRAGCSRSDRLLVLHEDHRRALGESLEAGPERILAVGAGFRSDLFHPRGRSPGGAEELLYVGKYSHAKGLPWLLDALERLARDRPGLRLHVAGSGAGEEARGLLDRMRSLAPRVVLHGQLAQPALADLMRRCAVCVLPSFYEGLPLVLAEACACGCRLVATELPGVAERLAAPLGKALELVALPRMVSVDRPRSEDLPDFVTRLAAAIATSLDRWAARGPVREEDLDLASLTWRGVFRCVEAVWRTLLDPAATSVPRAG